MTRVLSDKYKAWPICLHDYFVEADVYFQLDDRVLLMIELRIDPAQVVPMSIHAVEMALPLQILEFKNRTETYKQS